MKLTKCGEKKKREAKLSWHTIHFDHGENLSIYPLEKEVEDQPTWLVCCKQVCLVYDVFVTKVGKISCLGKLILHSSILMRFHLHLVIMEVRCSTTPPHHMYTEAELEKRKMALHDLNFIFLRILLLLFSLFELQIYDNHVYE